MRKERERTRIRMREFGGGGNWKKRMKRVMERRRRRFGKEERERRRIIDNASCFWGKLYTVCSEHRLSLCIREIQPPQFWMSKAWIWSPECYSSPPPTSSSFRLHHHHSLPAWQFHLWMIFLLTASVCPVCLERIGFKKKEAWSRGCEQSKQR